MLRDLIVFYQIEMNLYLVSVTPFKLTGSVALSEEEINFFTSLVMGICRNKKKGKMASATVG